VKVSSCRKTPTPLISKKVSGGRQCPSEISKLTAGNDVLYFFCIRSEGHAMTDIMTSPGPSPTTGFVIPEPQQVDAGEDFFRKILDALPTAIYTTDAAGRITYFNEAAAALWGHRPQIGTSEWCGSWKLF
jgi:PAS domain-containing protein